LLAVRGVFLWRDLADLRGLWRIGGVGRGVGGREGGREGGRAWVSWRGEERVEILFEREGGWWVKGKGMGGRVGG